MKSIPLVLSFILWVALPIGIGLILYDWFSPNPPLGIYKLDFLAHKKPIWPGLIYNVPDGLWSFALMSAMLIIWKKETNGVGHFWIMLTVFVAFGAEFGQKFGWINGTFDWLDVTAIGVGLFLSVLLLYKRKT